MQSGGRAPVSGPFLHGKFSTRLFQAPNSAACQ